MLDQLTRKDLDQLDEILARFEQACSRNEMAEAIPHDIALHRWIVERVGTGPVANLAVDDRPHAAAIYAARTLERIVRRAQSHRRCDPQARQAGRPPCAWRPTFNHEWLLLFPRSSLPIADYCGPVLRAAMPAPAGRRTGGQADAAANDYSPNGSARCWRQKCLACHGDDGQAESRARSVFVTQDCSVAANRNSRSSSPASRKRAGSSWPSHVKTRSSPCPRKQPTG